MLPLLPEVEIGGLSAAVRFAGVISPGLYQFNVTIPVTANEGDNPLKVTYAGITTPEGVLIALRP
jgi:uncharacterized protein (TIGR03437 family)